MDSAQRTRTAARIIGPYMAIAGVAMIIRADAWALILPSFMQDAPLVLATSAFTLMAGLTLLALHHHWSSPAAVAVSLIAVAATLKGAWLMLAPDWGAPLTAAVVRSPILYAAAAFDLAVGLWLTFVGWAARKGNP